MPLTDEQIITELRSMRATPSEAFSAELDAWAAAGFPKASELRAEDPARQQAPGRLGSWWRRMRERPMRSAVLGGVAVASVFAIAITVSLKTYEDDVGQKISRDSSDSDSETVGVERGGAGAAAEAGRAGDASVATPEPTTVPPTTDDIPATSPPFPGDEKLKPGQERVQERSASMTLSTEPGEVDDVADQVVDVVDRHQGIVVSSDVRTSADRGRANFDLRIPTANLQAALADLSDLASVSSRDEGTLDITTPFITAEERYKDAKAEVDALREQLSEADTTSEVDDLRERLRNANFALVAARNELGALKERSDYSVVSVTVLGDGDADGWSLGDAADDAGNVLEDLAGAALVALAVIVPLGAVALAIWLGLAALRRRQREQTLDQS